MGQLWALIVAHQDSEPYRPSIRQIAFRAGIGQSTLNKWQELKHLPDPDHLRAVARAIGQPYQVLLDAALADAGYGGETRDADAAPTKRAARRGRLTQPDQPGGDDPA